MELTAGRIKSSPEDFLVEEIPAYEPSGAGSHLFVRFEKRNLTTDAAVHQITRALGLEMRDAGIAGMKDKVAVTSQWISLLVPPKSDGIEERAATLTLPGIRVLAAKRHGNKLKTGHLRGNRFEIVVRGVAPAGIDRLRRGMELATKDGVPNAFGVQRFGKDGDTAERARRWLTGKERAPSDPRLRRFHFSALQAAIFNAVLAERVADGSWNVPALGDVLKKADTGGLFVCTDVQQDRERAARGEVCPTGPLVGERMRQAEGGVRELEDRIAAPFLEGVDLKRARTLGEGTRRALALRVTESTFLEVMERPGQGSAAEAPERPEAEQDRACRVSFVLPKGAYATTVLSAFMDVIDASRERGREGESDAGRSMSESPPHEEAEELGQEPE